jgi:hypothetical protein
MPGWSLFHRNRLIPHLFSVEDKHRFGKSCVVSQFRVTERRRCSGNKVRNHPDPSGIYSARFNPLLKFAIGAVVWKVHKEKLCRHLEPAFLGQLHMKVRVDFQCSPDLKPTIIFSR